MTFAIGDHVVINEASRGHYTTTLPGSRGIIVGVGLVPQFWVKFTEIARANGTFRRIEATDFGAKWNILESHLSLSYKNEEERLQFQQTRIQQTMQRLMRRQQFYREFRDQLPSW